MGYAKMSGPLKKATGLTGLTVSRNPHQTLKAIYGKILNIVGKMPEEAAYKKYTALTIQERLQFVNTEPNVEKLEQKINCGQAEELILQAENELRLARKMLHWRAWEPLIEEAPKNQWKWPI